MDRIVKIYSTPLELAEKFAEEMVYMINESANKKEPFTIALSGGSTPELLFTLLSKKHSENVPWQYVHFFWGDERCVSPDNIESNYGAAFRKLLAMIEIPSFNIHRIIGEDDPYKEASRYSEEILLFTRNRDGLPLFDLVLLGLGEDGHTASIFPGNLELFESDRICDVTFHPDTQQKRITVTGRIINNADSVVFLVTGRKKNKIVEKILKNSQSASYIPAYFVVPVYGRLSWLIDQDAANLL